MGGKGVEEKTQETPTNLSELREKFTVSQRRTREMFLSNYGDPLPSVKVADQMHLAAKINAEYALVKTKPQPKAVPRKAAPTPQPKATEVVAPTPSVTIEEEKVVVPSVASQKAAVVDQELSKMIQEMPANAGEKSTEGAMVAYKGGVLDHLNPRTALLLKQRERLRQQPDWHAPWKLMRVISGHLGWVRCVSMDPANEWFATGAADRTIKIWDLASGTLKLTLTGHISTVRGLAVSQRHPYLFSVAEDKTVKCWDLEYNKVIRSYHGHLSGVYSCELHPTIDVLLTGGRDSTARVWDIRTKSQIKVLAGHTNTISSIKCQPVEPQVITGSHDSTIRCWDLISGKSTSILTNHKKSVRAVGIHHSEYTFYSASTDNIKVWKCPRGEFMRNMSGHNAIVNCMALNQDNVMVSGGDNGSMHFWDWKTGYNYQTTTAVAQPGSMDSENGVFAMTFDQTGSRLITCEADKSIKIYKEDEEATEEKYPINYKPALKRKRY